MNTPSLPIRRFARIYLPIALLLLTGVALYGQGEIAAEMSGLLARESANLDRGAAAVSRDIHLIAGDLAFLEHHAALRAAVEAPNPENLAHLGGDWVNFSSSMGRYDQIRWLDESGMERVRVDYAQGRPLAVAPERLQHKGKRYYFTDAFRLVPGEVFVSPLDLNIEQDRIEIPYKPMLRVATPIQDGQGRKRGILILNYLGREMLDAFAAATAGIADHAMLVNGEGYCLKCPDPEAEWGFMFERPDLSLAMRAPASWEQLRAGGEGQLRLADGLWTWRTVYPLVEGQPSSRGTEDALPPSRGELESRQYVWKVIAHLPPETLWAIERGVWLKLSGVAALLLALLGLGSWRLAQAWQMALAAQERTAEAEEKYRTIADYTYDWETWLDPRGRFIYCSPSCERITGYPASAFMEDPELFRRIIHPEDRTGVATHLEEHRIDQDLCTLEFRVLTRDGDRRWLEHLCVAVHNERGEFLGRRGSNRDITERKQAELELRRIDERKRAELELRQAKERAEAANRAKSAFLAHMSHELRTPLNAMLGYAQILQQDRTLDEAQRNGVAIIRRSGDHLLSLINDVLDLAKIESGRFDLNPAPCSLHALFGELEEMFRARSGEKGIAFHYVETTPLPPLVEADEKRLRQIAINLLGNAVKFTERGEVRLEVGHLKFPAPNPTQPLRGVSDSAREIVILEVIDTGIGIPPGGVAALFQPFRQEGSAEYRRQGTGLGLAISKGLIEQMGGTIAVESEPGRGSRFLARLPLRTLAGDASEADGTAAVAGTILGYRRRDGGMLAPGRPLRILVVDDLADNREMVRSLLEPLGFEVAEAADGEGALREASEVRPDLVLMDLVMPGIDGLETTRRLHALPGCGDLPVVACSASAFPEDRTNSAAAGCLDHIAKPVRVEELFALLKRHLGLEWATEIPAQPPPAADAGSGLTPDQRAMLLALARRGDIARTRMALDTLPAGDFVARLRESAGRFDLKTLRQLLAEEEKEG